MLDTSRRHQIAPPGARGKFFECLDRRGPDLDHGTLCSRRRLLVVHLPAIVTAASVAALGVGATGIRDRYSRRDGQLDSTVGVVAVDSLADVCVVQVTVGDVTKSRHIDSCLVPLRCQQVRQFDTLSVLSTSVIFAVVESFTDTLVETASSAMQSPAFSLYPAGQLHL